MRPHSVERLGDDPRVAQCLVEQFRARPENNLRHLERLGGVAFLDLLREAFLEIRFVPEMREMNGHGLGERPHPVDRQHLDHAPRPQRPRVELGRQPHKIGRFGFEVMAKLTEFPELFVVQKASCADAAKRSGQLVMMSIAIGEPVIVDEYP